MQSEIALILQSLRGAQPLVVLAYLLVRQAMTVEDIEIVTGLDNDTVRKAVKGLGAKGLLFQQRGEHGRAVWLPASDTFFGIMSQNPKISDSAPVLSSSSRINQKSLPIEKEQEEEAPESENFGLCRKACDEAGIREPKRSLLSRLPHVTPEFIRLHMAQGKREHAQVGTVIYRIENNWEPVVARAQGKPGRVRPARSNFDEFGAAASGSFDDGDGLAFCMHQDVVKVIDAGTDTERKVYSAFCKKPVVNGSRFCAAHQERD